MPEGALAFGYGNLTDSSTLGGGNWSSLYPLSNLKLRSLAKQARASTSSVNDATLLMDHQTPAAAQLFAIFAHNVGGAMATIEINRSDTPGDGDILTTTKNVWDFSPLGGDRDGSYFGIFVLADNETSARYTQIKLTTNTGLAARFGRPFVGPVFFPDPCAAELVDDWLPSFSSLSRTESGADWTTTRPNLRSAKVSYQYMNAAKASLLSEIVRTHGTTKELVYLPTVQGAAFTQQYGFLATLRSLPSLECTPNQAMERGSIFIFDERGGAP